MLQDLYVPGLPTSPTSAVGPRMKEHAYLWKDEWLTSGSVDKDIVVRLKWGETEYKGRLVSVDGYMNIQLSGAEEWVDLKKTGDLGQVLIRCVPSVPPPAPNPLSLVLAYPLSTSHWVS